MSDPNKLPAAHCKRLHQVKRKFYPVRHRDCVANPSYRLAWIPYNKRLENGYRGTFLEGPSETSKSELNDLAFGS